MTRKNDIKECYEIETKNGAFYMGGKIQWSLDEQTIICPASEVLNVVDVETGRIRTSLGVTTDAVPDLVLCFAANANCELVVSAHRSGLFKLWNTSDGTLVKSWKSIHRGPVAQLVLQKGDAILASGGSDGKIRLWDLNRHACTHALRGASGVISVLSFSPSTRQLYGAGDDLKIRGWCTKSGKVLVELAGHFSKVTGLAFSENWNQMISCARDKVIILWDLKAGTATKTVPVYETLEGLFLFSKNAFVPGDPSEKGLHIAVAGDTGTIKIYDILTGRQVYVQKDSIVKGAEDGGLSIVQLISNAANTKCAVATADQNIIIYNVQNFSSEKQLVGFADEILDIALFGHGDSHIAVATNSADIKVYNIKDMGCQLLRGHPDFVLSLNKSPSDPRYLLSGGKDGSVWLWALNKEGIVEPKANGMRHTAAVNSVCFTCLASDTFLSASLDTTLKLWKLQDGINVIRTEVAHNKDINSVTISPNDKIIATASQDKSIKLWASPDLSLLGVLTGHRRGVWSVRFSPVDQILLSSSADCTMKLWSIADLTCLKTLEGHESSVLRAEFLSRGMQIISCSGDGLLKLWTIKSSECTATFDGHDGKVWALAVTEEEDKLVTGGSDSLLLLWKDSTEEKKLAALEARETMMLQEQQLSNLIQADRLFDALSLALTLDRPFKVLNIIKDIINNKDKNNLVKTLSELDQEQKERLLKCASAWNCNAKHSAVAQLVISVLLDQIATGKLRVTDLPGYIQEVLPYTERHYKRLTQTLQGLQLIEYTLHKINPALVNIETSVDR